MPISSRFLCKLEDKTVWAASEQQNQVFSYNVNEIFLIELAGDTQRNVGDLDQSKRIDVLDPQQNVGVLNTPTLSEQPGEFFSFWNFDKRQIFSVNSILISRFYSRKHT